MTDNFCEKCAYTANPPCNENRVFPAKFSLQGKTTSNKNRFFPVEKTSQGKPCIHFRFFPVKVCSVANFLDAVQ